MTIQNYIQQINKKYQSGISKEHAYRTDLENLLRALAQDADIINEPANVTDCGNPDFVITRETIPVGYIEAKDIGKDLNSKQYKEQFTRYRKALDNLIFTDYLWFQFVQDDTLVHEVRIGEIKEGKLVSLPENFAYFTNLITDFCGFIGQTVKSAQKLAELMAGKARLLQNILENAVSSDEQTAENTSLRGQIAAFRNVLIHDITPKEFADIYAQTLAYGMFAARLCVVLGNPLYAVSSSNKGEWIQNLIADYKKDLNERKLNLDDDYIKFIRYGEYLIEKNREGILAFISNNSFIDGITHRQMRKHLLETFDKIYILDLHGNAKKKETAPDGGKDEGSP